jgi:hypothetical protein
MRAIGSVENARVGLDAQGREVFRFDGRKVFKAGQFGPIDCGFMCETGTCS